MAKALLIDYEWCSGCHTCEVACRKALGLGAGQFGIKLLQDGPRQLPDSKKWEYNYLPMPTSLCDLCAEREAIGKLPSCVHHCPTHAILVGEVDEMAAEAAKRAKCAVFVPTL